VCEPAGFGPDAFSWSGLALDFERMLDDGTDEGAAEA
jgi:hypothetical protein